jgi:hypothetical protein
MTRALAEASGEIASLRAECEQLHAEVQQHKRALGLLGLKVTQYRRTLLALARGASASVPGWRGVIIPLTTAQHESLLAMAGSDEPISR